MTRLYVVRHCQATGQAPEAPLTPEGRQQAERLADFLADKGADCLVSSPFVRAQATIAPLAARLGLKVAVDDRLGERVLAGGELPDWRAKLEQTFADLDLALPGGESSRTAMARAAAAVDAVLATGARCAVIVTHGNLMALLLKRFDDRIGFAHWAALTNPDVFVIESNRVERIWQ
jgi:2,3-bisphosphoglycerate-dependent phosphoglycerate mutase